MTMGENYLALCFACLLTVGCKCAEHATDSSRSSVPPMELIAPANRGADPGSVELAAPDRELVGEISSNFNKRKTAQRVDWYDPAPLLVSLRPEISRNSAELVSRLAGINHLNDLPLYDLQVELDSAAGSFTLSQNIWYTNTTGASLAEIVLRLYSNTVGTRTASDRSSASVRLVAGLCTRGPECHIEPVSESALSVRLHHELPPGGRVCIRLDLTGKLQHIHSSRTNLFAQGLEGMATMNTHGAGGDYGLLSQGDGIISLAHFYAVLARRHFGKWLIGDESTMGDLGSDDMGHVRARVTTDTGMRVAATGVRLGPAKPGTNGRVEHLIGAALVRDFSLLCSRDYDVAEKRVGEVQVRSYFLRKEREAGLAALDAAAHALKLFQSRFGLYPYRDFDVVEAPLVGGAGGVEFAGLVTVASMLYRPADHSLGGLTSFRGQELGGQSSAEQLLKSMLEFVVVHEVAHQYWHGLVGSDSRKHPFDDEGLAQWSSVFYMEDRYGKDRAEREAQMQVAMGYRMMRMSGVPDGPADRPVASFGTPLAYGGLVYGKAPFVYRELRRAVGDRVFFRTLSEYVDRYKFDLAPNRAFISMLAQKHGSVPAIASRWLDEKYGDEDLGVGNMEDMMNLVMGPDYSQAMKVLGLDGLSSGSEKDALNSKSARQILEDLDNLSSGGAAPNHKELEQLEKLLTEELGL